jgi:hypothetical protein
MMTDLEPFQVAFIYAAILCLTAIGVAVAVLVYGDNPR